jgi:hypothetical protein
LTDYHEIQRGGHGIEGDLDFIYLNSSRMAEIKTSEINARLEPVNLET